MDTVTITTIDGRTAVIAVDQIASVWKAPERVDDRWVIELKTRNFFHVEAEFGKHFEEWFAGNITQFELHETVGS